MVNVLNKEFDDFRGGLNYVDPELNMNPRYLTEAMNVEIGYDSSVKKRNGFEHIITLLDYLEKEEMIIITGGGRYYKSEVTDTYVKWTKDEDTIYTAVDYLVTDGVFSDNTLTTPVKYKEEDAIILDNTKHEKIAEIFYFQLNVICYTNRGNIFVVNDKNEVSVVWSKTKTLEYYNQMVIQVAKQLAKAKYYTEHPTGTIEEADAYAEEHYTEFETEAKKDIGEPWTLWNYPWHRCFGNVFNNMLILSNGYDKPLQIMFEDLAIPCQYLHDPATGSNANIPRIYKCVTVNHYLCAICVGDNKVYISAKDVAGLWEDDTDGLSSGATHVDIGSVCSLDNQELLDVCMFKNNLGVLTNYYIVMIGLDIYEDEASTDDQGQDITVSRHHPSVETVVDNAGCVTVGSVRNIYDSVAFLSANGINSINRNVVSQNFTPESLSHKVLPYIKERLTDSLIRNGVSSFIDTRKFTYCIRFDDNTVLCMSFHPNLAGYYCFYLWDNIKYTTFCSNVYGRVLASDGYGLFIYADDSEGKHSDDYIDYESETVVSENFVMKFETPWLLYGKSSNVKTMEYINVVADGLARFELSSRFDLKDDNEIKIGMICSGNKGYGQGYQARGEGTDPYYGGSIIASNLNLIDFNQVFMYNKFVITSDDDKLMKLIRIGVHYKIGGIRR